MIARTQTPAAAGHHGKAIPGALGEIQIREILQGARDLIVDEAARVARHPAALVADPVQVPDPQAAATK